MAEATTDIIAPNMMPSPASDNPVPTAPIEQFDTKAFGLEYTDEVSKPKYLFKPEEPKKPRYDFIDYVNIDPTQRKIDEYINAKNRNALDNYIDADKVDGLSDLIKSKEGWALDLYGADEVERIKAKGAIGFVESVQKLNKWEMLPWLNAVAGYEDVKALFLMRQMSDNPQEMKPEDKQYVTEYLKDMAEIQLRGYSWGGHMGNIGLRMPAYAIEFAGAIASLGTSGTASVGRVAAKKGAKEAIGEAVEQTAKTVAKKRLAREVGEGAVKMAVQGAKVTINPRMWHRTARGIADVYMNDSIAITPKGQAIYQESEIAPATAFFRALGDTWAENSSELAGSYLFKPVAGAAGRQMSKAFPRLFKEAVEETTGMGWKAGIKKFGYDGIIEELGEERLGDILRVVANVDENEEWNLDGIGKALMPGWDQFMVEAGLVTIYGGTSYTSAALINKLSKKKDMSKDDLLNSIKDVEAMTEEMREKTLKRSTDRENEEDAIKYTERETGFRQMLEGQGMAAEEVNANVSVWNAFIATTALKTGKTRSELFDEIAPLVTREDMGVGLNQESRDITRVPAGEQHTLFQSKPESKAFYSKLEQTVIDKMPKSMLVKDFQNWINNQGLKAEEIQYSGINEFIQGKDKVSKEEVKQFLQENQIQIEEVVKGNELENYGLKENANFSDNRVRNYKRYDIVEILGKTESIDKDKIIKLLEFRGVSKEEANGVADWINENIESVSKYSKETKFFNWQLPGGENYREILFTLPTAIDNKKLSSDYEKAKQNYNKYIENADNTYGAEWSYYPSEVQKKAKELQKIQNDAYMAMDRGKILSQDNQYKSGHWSEKNVLVHTRLNDRTDAEGNKVLFVEEIQSDWHQEGKKKGYKGIVSKEDLEARWHEPIVPEGHNKDNYPGYWEVYNKKNGELIIRNAVRGGTAEENIQEALKGYVGVVEAQKVPDAPFKKTESWAGFAFKKILDMAVKQGYDKVAWTTGEQQAERYDLSKQINKVNYYPNTKTIEAYDLNNRIVLKEKGIDDNKLEDYIGKDLAKKIINDSNSGKDYTTYASELMNKYKVDNPNKLSEYATKEEQNKLDKLFNASNKDMFSYKGVDLKVGGEGMKGFYDDILPKFVDKYVKKWGTKTTDLEIIKKKKDGWYAVDSGFWKSRDNQYTIIKIGDKYNLSDGKTDRKYNSMEEAKSAYNKDNSTIVHSIDVTDAMKADIIGKGQALFQGKRGALITEGGMNIVQLMNADRSTFMHESAHIFLNYYLKNMPAELDAVFKFAGIAKKPLNELTPDEYRKLQESFATGFEVYLAEGKAPNMSLADAFARFKEWLTDIYEEISNIVGLSGLDIKVSEDIKQFFDEMLNAEDLEIQIDPAMNVDGGDIDMVLYQDAVKKVEELKKRRDALVAKYGDKAKEQLRPINNSIKDLETMLLGVRRSATVKAANDAWKELPISQVFEDKIRISPEYKDMMERYSVPANVKTKEATAKTLDEYKAELGMSEEKILEQVKKIGSKKQFVDSYIKQNAEEIASTGLTPELVEGDIAVVEERLTAAEVTRKLRQAGNIVELVEREMSRTPEDAYAKVVSMYSKRSEMKEKIGDNLSAAKEWGSDVFVPVTSTLGAVSKKLKYALRKFEMAQLARVKKHDANVRGFIEKYQDLPIDDALRLDYALKLSDIKTIAEIVKRNGMEAEYASVIKTLEDIYDEAEEVKMGLGYLINYFPRKIKDPSKFMQFIRNNEGWNFISESLSQEDPTSEWTEAEQAEFISTMLRGYGGANVLLSKPSYTKDRQIIELTPEMNEYYEDSAQTLMNYIRAMSENIEGRRFFGKNDQEINDSIGMVVKEMIENGDLDQADAEIAKKAISARFNAKGVSKVFSTFRNITYLTSLNSVMSAITQVNDIGLTLYKTGLLNTAVGLAKSLTGNSVITVQDLGLTRILQEFEEQGNMQKTIETVFKYTGFEFMDRLGKQSYLNASYLKYKELAAKNDSRFHERLNDIFGEEASQVLNDIKTGTMSENVKLLLFNEICEIQPITLSEMPITYLTGGNGRVFYTLKSFTVKRLNWLFNEIRAEMNVDAVNGMYKLTRLMFCLMLLGYGEDRLKNLLLGREQEPSEYFLQNLLKVFGLGKWLFFTAKREGIASAIMQQILPPAKIFNDIGKDIMNLTELQDLRTISNIPIFGKLFYWWFGGGSEAGKERQKERRKANSKSTKKRKMI